MLILNLQYDSGGDMNMKNIIVKEKVINITGINDDDFVSLTDIARI
jgi:hypothetical protein